MEKSWNEYMKVGIVSFMAFPQTIKGEGPILETLKRIVEDEFFKAIEITWIKDEKIRTQARDLLSSWGGKIGYGAQPPLLLGKLNLNSEDEEIRQRAIQQVKDCLDEARFLGASSVAVLSGQDPGEAKRGRAKELLIESLKELLDHGQTLGLPLILEIFDRKPFGKNRLLGPTSEAVKMAKELRKSYSSFGLMVDLSHLPLLQEKPQEALIEARDYLSAVHIGNCVMRDSNHPAYGDEHPPFGIPGGENGVEELRELLRVLLEIGYLNTKNPGMVSFEIKPFEGWTSEKVITNAKETLKQAWAKL